MTTVLTARTPEDLLAAVPVVLGFRPADSVVMLTFGGRHCFGARVDLPDRGAPSARLRELNDVLLEPAVRHGVDRVAFVVYTGDASLAARLGRRLVRSFLRADIAVVDVLRAHRGRFTRVPCRDDRPERPLRPYDDRAHPFAAQAVFEGRVTRASRDDLRADLAADPDLRQATRRALLALPPPGPEEPAAVLALLDLCVTAARVPDDREAARVLRLVAAVDVRDAALFAVTEDSAVAHLAVWSSLLRRAPDPKVPDTAAVTAFCAWRAGHGALAWCALDRCFEADPEQPLGLALAECLVRAVPPTAWSSVGSAPGPTAGSTAGSEAGERPDGESGTA